jgi:hyperosmotically inducible protein
VATPAPEPAKPVEAAKPEAPSPDPNAELAQRVKQALEGEAKIQAAAIDVTAAEGKVTLWGTASSAGERSRAADVAGKVQGVKSVENKIAVVRGS